mgnify:FL=1|jgi:hypothetical protein|tara:strand:- start:585 stop:875 length:291 start_codon:yes stop_codon:yes gene_type:complete
MKEIPIRVNKNEVFNFVVGNSIFDPIEKCIDPTRYEVFDTFIYDHESCKKLIQGPIYNKFCWEVSKLKNNAPNMTSGEIIRICEELEEIAPKLVSI